MPAPRERHDPGLELLQHPASQPIGVRATGRRPAWVRSGTALLAAVHSSAERIETRYRRPLLTLAGAARIGDDRATAWLAGTVRFRHPSNQSGACLHRAGVRDGMEQS